MIGSKELVIIFLIIFLLFGAKKLPQIARALRKAKDEFENPSKELCDEETEAVPVAKEPEEKE